MERLVAMDFTTGWGRLVSPKAMLCLSTGTGEKTGGALGREDPEFAIRKMKRRTW